MAQFKIKYSKEFSFNTEEIIDVESIIDYLRENIEEDILYNLDTELPKEIFLELIPKLMVEIAEEIIKRYK